MLRDERRGGFSFDITFLNCFDVDALALEDQEILAAVEQGLLAQGERQAVIEPRTHLEPNAGQIGHFNVLRGWIGGAVNLAGVKVVSDYYRNYEIGLPSELATLLLLDPRTGAPCAIIDATRLTDMRTGAMSAIGAKFLAPREARVLANIGARGSSYWNCRLIARLFDLDEIRIHSRRPESRGLKRGALIMPYGTMSAVDDDLTGIMDKILMDDWGQRFGTKGALRRHVDSGLLSSENFYGELCDVVAGAKPGRESDTETILFWHRGLSLSDIALGYAMLDKAKRLSVGQRLRFW